MAHIPTRVILAMTFGLLAGCDSTAMPNQTLRPTDPLADQEQAVYTAVLKDLASATPYYVLRQEIRAFSPSEMDAVDFALVTQEISQVSAETLASFWARNETIHYLSADLNLGVPYVVLESATIHAFFAPLDHNGWQRFYAKYPEANGMHGFSHVGFNANHDQALVYFEWRGGYLAGMGQYVLLVKTGDTWNVVQHVEIWRS